MGKQVKILMGLPLAGKTTWINEQNFDGWIGVSADTIKEAHPDYNPTEAHKLHIYSVQEAEKRMNDYSDRQLNIVMDTGAINSTYTTRIIKMLHNKDYTIELIHIKTPLLVCLKRNQERNRKVPEQAIIEKAFKENAQFYRLIKLVDSYQVVDYFSNDNIFIDMDGVIAAQTTLPIINGELDFVNGEIHKHQAPVMQVIEKFQKLKSQGKKLYILSAIPNSISLQEKNDWLDANFNIVPKDCRFFVNRGKHKAEMLENLATKFKLKKKDVTLVDDMHQTLYNVLNRKMNPMHVSEFLTHKF